MIVGLEPTCTGIRICQTVGEIIYFPLLVFWGEGKVSGESMGDKQGNRGLGCVTHYRIYLSTQKQYFVGQNSKLLCLLGLGLTITKFIVHRMYCLHVHNFFYSSQFLIFAAF